MSLSIEPLAIAAVKLICPRVRGDDRGRFCETWNRAALAAHGIDIDFVQDNESLSRSIGTVRGLHYQIQPFAQTKLVRVSSGRILDVAVDLRRDQPSFGKHVHAVLSAEEAQQILVPVGFAHAFFTLEPNTVVHYKVDAPYAPGHERGIRWNDPSLAIDWPVDIAPTLSPRDTELPLWRDVVDLF